MSEISNHDKQIETIPETTETAETDRPVTNKGDVLNPFGDPDPVYDDFFKKCGLVSDGSEGETEKNSDSAEKSKYSEYLEKTENGKYKDKETGKEYDSVEDWEKEQKFQAKRYLGVADYYEDKAKKEWARYKNAEANGESEEQKWKHHRKSQEYYQKAKDLREKAEKILDKLGITKEELTESSESKMGSFDAVPDNRRECVTEFLENAPEGIKNVFQDMKEMLSVEDSPEYVDEYGNISHSTSFYYPENDTIYMNPEYDDDEYAEVFSHEYGHFADDQMDDFSGSEEFTDAMNLDMEKFNGVDGEKLKAEMIEDLSKRDALFDRAVSDILSGMFLNDPRIIEMYYSEGAPYYQHSTDYWLSENASMVGKEVFANAFSIYSDSSKKDSVSFIEKYFPNTCEVFKERLSI